MRIIYDTNELASTQIINASTTDKECVTLCVNNVPEGLLSLHFGAG